MSNHNTSSNPASSGDAPASSPVASRTRGATAGRQADPTPGVEADVVAATNPPAAGDAASTGIDQSLVVENVHDESESESSDSTESSADSNEFVPAADDAAESRARMDAALAALGACTLQHPNALAQIAERDQLAAHNMVHLVPTIALAANCLGER